MQTSQLIMYFFFFGWLVWMCSHLVFHACFWNVVLPPSGQRDSAISVSLWGGSHLSVAGAEGQASPFVSLPRDPLPWGRLCGPDLKVSWGEKAASKYIYALCTWKEKRKLKSRKLSTWLYLCAFLMHVIKLDLNAQHCFKLSCDTDNTLPPSGVEPVSPHFTFFSLVPQPHLFSAKWSVD